MVGTEVAALGGGRLLTLPLVSLPPHLVYFLLIVLQLRAMSPFCWAMCASSCCCRRDSTSSCTIRGANYIAVSDQARAVMPRLNANSQHRYARQETPPCVISVLSLLQLFLDSLHTNEFAKGDGTTCLLQKKRSVKR